MYIICGDNATTENFFVLPFLSNMYTGSADKTVKFWDLETFELIGSSGPEVSDGF